MVIFLNHPSAFSIVLCNFLTDATGAKMINQKRAKKLETPEVGNKIQAIGFFVMRYGLVPLIAWIVNLKFTAELFAHIA